MLRLPVAVSCGKEGFMRTITKTQAAQFILVRQGLLGNHRFIGKDGAFQYVRQAGCIQYDPVDVCGKNAELTLQSRVRGFRKQMLDDLLYRDRLLVDYSDKELSIWPSEDWPYFAGYRERSREHGAGFAGIPELEEKAVAWIREHGPVSSDTLPVEGTIFWHSSMHWSGHWHKESQAARSVLEQLYTDGVLLIHHKSGSRKYYDLAEKYLPAGLLNAANPCPDEASFLDWRIMRRIGAVGLLWNRRSDAWLGIAMTSGQRDAAFDRLERSGSITAVRVEGLRFPLYLLSSDLPLLESVVAGQADTRPRLEFLAPLDPMLWDRKLIEALWNYQYSWEIYTPVSKRKYGYYVLPVLYGDRFVGRIEPKADRKAKVLTVGNVWLEPGVRRTKKLDSLIGGAVRRLAKFNGCDEDYSGCAEKKSIFREGCMEAASVSDASAVKKQYASSEKLDTRISIHEKYSVNRQGFGSWIASHYRFEAGFSVLELGCGTGSLWQGQDSLIRACSRLVLTDLSEGMLQKAKETLARFSGIEYRITDIQDIPFADHSFDAVIANMMLYHVPDIRRGLDEVRRVLKPGGTFYCATYGEHGILEYLSGLFGIPEAAGQASHSFTLQNGEAQLRQHFADVRRDDYPDALAVTNAGDLADYILSLSGMTALRDIPRDKLVSVLEANMSDGVLTVPKEYGMFIARP